jgi:hypothetical protein
LNEYKDEALTNGFANNEQEFLVITEQSWGYPLISSHQALASAHSRQNVLRGLDLLNTHAGHHSDRLESGENFFNVFQKALTLLRIDRV